MCRWRKSPRAQLRRRFLGDSPSRGAHCPDAPVLWVLPPVRVRRARLRDGLAAARDGGVRRHRGLALDRPLRLHGRARARRVARGPAPRTPGAARCAGRRAPLRSVRGGDRGVRLVVPGAFRGLASATARALRGAGPWAWYAAETVEVALAMLPACTAMGATLPLGVFALARGGGPVRRFSYLYLAHVLGAVLGTLLSAFVFIELVGFRGTLQIAALANAVVAALRLPLARHRFAPGPVVSQQPEPDAEPVTDPRILVALFFSRLCSTGLEVVWTRLYTPFVGTVVYSFASILALYLASTFAGSMAYRVLRPSGSPLRGLVWAAVAVMAAAPLLATDWAHFADLRPFNQWQGPGFGWGGVAP